MAAKIHTAAVEALIGILGSIEVRSTPAHKVKLITGERAGEVVDVAPTQRVAFSVGLTLAKKVHRVPAEAARCP